MANYIEKRAWFQIDNLIFTAPRYLREYLNSVLGKDDKREIVWINKTASHLYATRWRPDFCYVNILVNSVDTLNSSLRFNKIGNLVVTSTGKFLQVKKTQIDAVSSSPYYPEVLGKTVQIIHGPLEDFYGKIIAYSTELKKYIVSVKLLVSEVHIPHHFYELFICEPEDFKKNSDVSEILNNG